MVRNNNYKARIACPASHAHGAHKGFSVLELILTAALFSVFSLAIVLAVLQGSSAGQAAEKAEKGRLFAREGLEAVRAMRSRSFDSLQDSQGTGLRFNSGQWEFFGSSDAWEGYTRTISVQPARRDGDDIVVTGGTEDNDSKLVTVTVVKDNFTVEFSAYFSRREIVPIGP